MNASKEPDSVMDELTVLSFLVLQMLVAVAHLFIFINTHIIFFVVVIQSLGFWLSSKKRRFINGIKAGNNIFFPSVFIIILIRSPGL